MHMKIHLQGHSLSLIVSTSSSCIMSQALHVSQTYTDKRFKVFGNFLNRVSRVVLNFAVLTMFTGVSHDFFPVGFVQDLFNKYMNLCCYFPATFTPKIIL